MATNQSTRRLWKAYESVVARDFGTERNPLSGENSRHSTSSDSLHSIVYIEAKRDQSFLGKKLSDLVEDTIQKAKAEKKLPMIAIKRKGKRGYIVMCLDSDLKRIADEKLG